MYESVCKCSFLRYSSTEIMETAGWAGGAKILDSKLPNTVLHSQADSTIRKYLGGFQRRKTWTVSYNLEPIPVKPHLLALYLQHLEQSKAKAAVVEDYTYCNRCTYLYLYLLDYTGALLSVISFISFKWTSFDVLCSFELQKFDLSCFILKTISQGIPSILWLVIIMK